MKIFQKLFVNAFKTIITLFFTIVYIYMNNYLNIDISRSYISGIPPLLSY